MRRYFLDIEYDGRPFLGWQRQDDGPTVQGVIEEAIAKIDPRSVGDPEILVYGSGRTDAGVHAMGQVAHTDFLREDLSPFKIMSALNHHMRPHPVSILDVYDVGPDVHARFHAVGRHYTYKILNRRPPPTFESGQVWHVVQDLDEEKMADAASVFIGTHDFTTFRHAHCQAKSPIKTLDYFTVERSGDYLEIQTGARSFLHHQVRSMVGCLALVGIGRWSKDRLQKAMDAKSRQALGLNAPSDGLYFRKIDFDPAYVPGV